MLPTRLLPPQFLAPSWSVRQLSESAVRRERHRGQEPKPKEPATSQTPLLPPKSRQFARSQHEVPLYEELFPEETKRRKQPPPGPDFGGPGNFERLPAFEWWGDELLKPAIEKTESLTKRTSQIPRREEPTGNFTKVLKEETKKSQDRIPAPRIGWGDLSAIPRRTTLGSQKDVVARVANPPNEVGMLEIRKVFPRSTAPPEVKLEAPVETTFSRHNGPYASTVYPVRRTNAFRRSESFAPDQDELTPEAKQRMNSSLLVLHCAGGSLEESDFLRIGAKGQHIEGWARDIIKVFPSRDPATLQPLGRYFILFNNDDSARAYQEEINRLHHLARHGSTGGRKGMTLPPDFFLREEENKLAAARFTLVPPGVHHPNTILRKKPYPRALERVLADAGPAALRLSPVQGKANVLFTISCSLHWVMNLTELLHRQGKERNLQWEFATKQITRSFLDLDRAEHERNSMTGNTRDVSAHSRWVISFKDQQEARRFVREWHCRKIKDPSCGVEEVSTTRAQILW